jgi:flagellar biosynthetic protein FliR
MFEAIGFTLAQLEIWLLIFVRFLTLLTVLPFFSIPTIDPRLRVFLAIALTTFMVRLVPYPDNFPVEFLYLMFYVAREILIGLCIGMFGSFFTEIVKFAGSQTSSMIGLDMASLIDPTTSEETQAMPELFNIIAILLILTLNGHHFFLRAMFDSLFIIPITGGNFTAEYIPQMTTIATNIIALGIRMAAPIVIIVFLVRIIVGIINRLVQDADVFSIILVLDILIGFYILMYYWPYFAQMTNAIFIYTQNQVLTIIRLLSTG